MSYQVHHNHRQMSNEGAFEEKITEKVPAKELVDDTRKTIKQAITGIGDPEELSGSNHKNGTSLHATAGHSFRNAPLVSFIYKDNQDKMQSALREVRKRLGEKHPLYIGGEKIWTDNLTPSVNPAE